jgi:alkylhydroperoxidase/carboxymuconolactone decarboxylase family protein YurZ
MEEKYRILVALGAATAANCVPCFEHYYKKALEIKITEEEVLETVALGNQMKTGAQMAVRNSISEIMAMGKGNAIPSSGLPSMPSCCS